MSDKETVTEDKDGEWKQRSYGLETFIAAVLISLFILNAATTKQTPEAAAKAASYRAAGDK